MGASDAPAAQPPDPAVVVARLRWDGDELFAGRVLLGRACVFSGNACMWWLGNDGTRSLNH